MLGKQKCRILREIRRQIADQNGIAFATEECRFKGECKGSCPKCEAEVRYLEAELEKRRLRGKKVVLAGISIGTMVSMTACSAVDAMVDSLDLHGDKLDPEPIEELLGEVSGWENEAPEGMVDLTGMVAPMPESAQEADAQ